MGTEDVQGSRFDKMGDSYKLAFLVAEVKKPALTTHNLQDHQDQLISEATNTSPKLVALAKYLDLLPSLADYQKQGLPLTASDADLKVLAKLPHLRETAQWVHDKRQELQ